MTHMKEIYVIDPLDKSTLAPARRYLGLSQKELADAVDVHVNTINRIERSERNPSFKLWGSIVSVIRARLEEKGNG